MTDEDFHTQDCGIAGGWPHSAGAHCPSIGLRRVFTGYAYGDPLPIYATFSKDEDGADVILYLQCQRESHHKGKHYHHRAGSWTDEQRRIPDEAEDWDDWRTRDVP